MLWKMLGSCILGTLSFLITTETAGMQSPPLEQTPIGVARATKIVIGEGYVTDTDSVEVRITLLEVVRGKQAWELVKAANPLNKPPAPGFEYIVARIKFEFGEKGAIGNQKTYAVRDEQFASVSEGGRQYESPSIVQPKPALNGRLYVGESIEGWVTFLVAVDDKKPLMSFGHNYYRVWFRLFS
jgi:hypothetical protein